ncbi:hypothetical protein U1Q18_014791, partial [Sarracenia purpurea var. burkii]
SSLVKGRAYAAILLQGEGLAKICPHTGKAQHKPSTRTCAPPQTSSSKASKYNLHMISCTRSRKSFRTLAIRPGIEAI